MIAKILLVDDNDDLRAALKDALTTDRQIVIEAVDGAEAFAKAEEERPHLIIMDLVMPGLYGTTAVKRLRENKSTAGIPILLISGSVEQAVLKDYLQMPRLRYLPKPVDVKKLLETIREMLPEGGYTV